MELKCTLEERQSKKGGSYVCGVIHLTDKTTKTIFFEPSELELLQRVYSSNK